jgi:hypothetical protein
MLLISAAFVTTGVLILKDPKESPTIAWLVMIFFGLGIPIFGWRFIRPDVLTLTPDGISWRTMFRSARWTWDDVQNFRAYKPTSKTISKHLGLISRRPTTPSAADRAASSRQ